MRSRWIPTAILAAATLAAAGLAGGATATVSVTAEITGSETSYRLTVTNTGTEPIRCFGLLLDGVQPVSANGPAGVLTRVGTFQGRGLVHMQGDLVVPPGGTVSAEFRTNTPIAPNAGGEIRYSATCLPGSDVVGRATGPAPVPTAETCECTRLTVQGARYSSSQAGTGATRLKLTLRWFLSCSAGAGSCVGSLQLAKPPGTDVTVVTPRPATVTCEGKCDPGGATSASGTVVVTASSRRTLDFDNRRGKTVVLPVRRFCVRSGKAVQVGTTRIRLVFNGAGLLDRKKSDVNGNGKPDGAETT